MRLAICVVFVAAGAVCDAAPILDQYLEYDSCAGYDVCGGSVGGIWSDNAQTFTAGINGWIRWIDVQVQRLNINSGDLHFDLLPTIGGVPVEDLGMALASEVQPAGVVPMAPTWITFDLAGAGVHVQAGDILAIAIRDPSGGCCATYLWRGSFYADLYAGGQRFVRGIGAGPVWNGGILGTPPANEANIDLDFRVYVDAVPEPGTWTLMAAGMLIIVWAAVGSGKRSRY